MATTFYPLTVKRIERLTDECVSVNFEIPENLKEEFQFVPGQYLTLRTTLNDNEVRRSYSICCAPSESGVSVAIKKMPEGKFSTFANEVLKEGDVLETMVPMGNFVSKNDGSFKNYLFIAAGSGITPMMSLMSSILEKEKNATATLIYGNKNRASIIFKESIEALKNNYMNRLVVHHIFSRETADTDLFNGRITADKLENLGKLLVDYPAMDEIFICGPEEMIISTRDYLVNHTKLDANKVHIELFTSPDTPKVISEEWKQKLAQVDTTNQSKVTVKLDGVAFDMDLSYGGDNILDAALKQGADLPYACKGGVCATCKARLIEGEVDMEVNYSLEPDELAKNIILTCQSHPRSEKVVVDFDQK